MSHATRLDKASSYLFILGFIIAKLQYIPVLIIAPLVKFISLLFYLAAYSLWFIGGLIYPEHRKMEDRWYGFATLKEQYQLAAITGLAATVLSITALLIPVLALPAAWIFFVSNLIWAIGEHHKIRNPPVYELNYSQGHQSAYLSYAKILTAIALLTAISTTIIFFFPPLALPIFAIATLISFGLGAQASEYILDYNFSEYPLTPVANSYEQMNRGLGITMRSEAVNYPAPYHQQSKSVNQHRASSDLMVDANELTCK